MSAYSIIFLINAVFAVIMSLQTASLNIHMKKVNPDDITLVECLFILGHCIAWILSLGLWIGAYIHLPTLLEPYPIAGYIAAVLSILFMAFISSDIFLAVPNKSSTKTKDMLWREVVMSIRSSILYRINFKVLISILYIVILIVAQLETLEFIILPEKLSYFCKVHQYGIVIMYAFDKIVDAIKGHKAHKELVRDIDAEREEGLKAEHEARVAKRAKKKEERKIAKQKAHLLKQGKQEDEVQI